MRNLTPASSLCKRISVSVLWKTHGEELGCDLGRRLKEFLVEVIIRALWGDVSGSSNKSRQHCERQELYVDLLYSQGIQGEPDYPA